MEDSFYKQRINSAIDYIEENINTKLTLNELAKVAGFSKYHFHRIFKTVVGETLNCYIKRIKMEKVFKQLLINKNKPLTEIAFDMGFNSSANFSRDFYNYFKVSPSEIRNLNVLPAPGKLTFCNSGLDVEFKCIETIPDKRIIYNRITTGYNPDIINRAFQNLYESFLHNFPGSKFDQFIGIGYDDPDYTPPGKCRYDACLSVDMKFELTGNKDFNVRKFKGSKYALFSFEGKPEQFLPAWDFIFHDWLINSQYLPDNRPHLEMYLPNEKYTERIYSAYLCLPVKKIDDI